MEDVERNADGQRHRRLKAQVGKTHGGCQRIDIVDEKVGVFEITQHRKIHGADGN